MNERGSLELDALVTGLHLGNNGKPHVTVSIPAKREPEVVGPGCPIHDDSEPSVYITFPNDSLPMNIHVGDKVKVTVSIA